MGCLKHEALSPRVSAAFVEIQSASSRIDGLIVLMLVAETETSSSASSWSFLWAVGRLVLCVFCRLKEEKRDRGVTAQGSVGRRRNKDKESSWSLFITLDFDLYDVSTAASNLYTIN